MKIYHKILLYQNKLLQPYVRILLRMMAVLTYMASLLLIVGVVYEHGFPLSATDISHLKILYKAVWIIFLIDVTLHIFLEYKGTKKNFRKLAWILSWLLYLTLVPVIFHRPDEEGAILYVWDFLGSKLYHIPLLLLFSFLNLSNGLVRLLGRRTNPSLILAVSFFVIILIGTGLLLLPRCTVEGVVLSWVDALFTSTSAVCVTGLVPVDVSATFTPMGLQENSRIFLPKLGWMRYRNSRQVTGVVKNVTVSQSCGKWYISIQTESEVSTPVHPSASMVGLDAGVAKLATLSDGTVFEPVNSFQKNQKTLARLQRQLSRKVKFSNNWQKQKRKIQRLHSCIANIRRDYLHKVTTTVSKNHAMIVIEDLKVSNMSKSAAGTVSQPGRNVRAKSGLNRTILDQGWYEMRRQLEYKQLWRGGQVLAVPPAYTSQRCACCGHTAKENRLSQSQFRCQVCGYTANADVNGARNILAAGHAVLACGEMVQSGRPLKQEPTEMIQATA